MRVKIYKPGVMVEVYGISCDWKNVPEQELDGWLSSGWYRHPHDFDKEEAAEEAPKRRGRKPKAVTDDHDEE